MWVYTINYFFLLEESHTQIIDPKPKNITISLHSVSEAAQKKKRTKTPTTFLSR
jgi:hypothetical protein